MLKGVKEKLNYTTVHLTGGEPTLCKEIAEIAAMIKQNGLQINMVSNIIKVQTIIELANKGLLDELTFSYIPLDRVRASRIESLDNYKTSDYSKNVKAKENVLLLFLAFTGHHYTDVLMVVDNLLD